MAPLIAYLALGSNLGDRRRNISLALDSLERDGVAILRRSSMFETEPRDYVSQPWFLNMVAEVSCPLPPHGLLAAIRAIEDQMGRQRLIDKGPRTIDIDIVLFGNRVLDTADLVIPHPSMHERRFVLEPLAELAPELVHPVLGVTVARMLSDVLSQKVVKSGPLP